MSHTAAKRIAITGGSGFIGTNLVEYYLQRGWEVINLDFQPPRNQNHRSVWHNINLLDRVLLTTAIKIFEPTFLLHFAARTDLDEKHRLGGYAANIDGVRNIIQASKETRSLQRVIFASSQLVCKIGYRPKDEFDTCPSTLYGRSKVETEKIIRSTVGLQPSWVIVRPTSIWGPWFDIPYRSFFEAIYRGWYVHPGGCKTQKQWGFVGNAVHQIDQLLNADADKTHGKTFYLADYNPLQLEEFANLVQQEMNTRRIKKIPAFLLRTAAWGGDLLKLAGWKNPPLSSFRFKNMVTSELQDLSPLEQVAGPLPFSVQDGISQTVSWMDTQGIIHG